MSGQKLTEAIKMAAHEVTAEASFSFMAAIKSWGVLVLAGLGVTMAVDQFFGGLLFAVAAAAEARRRDRRKGRGLAIYSALTACVLAVIAAGLVTFYEVKFPIPLAMGLVGFFSRNIVNIMAGFGDRAEARSGEIADKVIDKVLPGGKE